MSSFLNYLFSRQNEQLKAIETEKMLQTKLEANKKLVELITKSELENSQYKSEIRDVSIVNTETSLFSTYVTGIRTKNNNLPMMIAFNRLGTIIALVDVDGFFRKLSDLNEITCATGGYKKEYQLHGITKKGTFVFHDRFNKLSDCQMFLKSLQDRYDEIDNIGQNK